MRGVKRALGLGLALFVVGCGGGGGGNGDGTTAAAPPTAAPVTVTTTKDTSQAEPRPTGKPTFDVRLTGENATPVAGQPWRYTVTATSKDGKPANATAKMRVFVEGDLVDTLGFFAFEGTLTRTHKWPTVLKGKDGVVLQAEVEGAGGTQRVNFPVKVA